MANWSESPRPRDIYHYGVKGMKWGVRRFQNPDGTLTAAGRKRYLEGVQYIQEQDKLSGQPYWRVRESEYGRKQARIKTKNKDTDYIKKGSLVNRIAVLDEDENSPKYVSLTDNDKRQYGEMFDMLGIPDDAWDKAGEKIYKTKKKMLIASGQNVSDRLIEKYGDKTVKQIYKDLVTDAGQQKNNIVDTDRFPGFYYTDPKTHEVRARITEEDAKKFQEVMDYAVEGKKLINNTLKKLYNDPNVRKETVEYYKSKGYDAIVDAEDWGVFDYPLLILDPSKSLKKISQRRFYDE